LIVKIIFNEHRRACTLQQNFATGRYFTKIDLNTPRCLNRAILRSGLRTQSSFTRVQPILANPSLKIPYRVIVKESISITYDVNEHVYSSSSFEPDFELCSVSVIPLQHRSCPVCMSFVRLGHQNG